MFSDKEYDGAIQQATGDVDGDIVTDISLDNDVDDISDNNSRAVMMDIPLANAGSSMPQIDDIHRRSDHSSIPLFRRKGMKTKLAVFGAIVLVAILGLAVSSVKVRKNASQSLSTSPRASVEEVIAYMTLHGVTDLESFLEDKNSPHYKAAEWIALKDEQYLPVPMVSIDEIDGYMYMFRYVMALNYFSMNGEGWDTDLHFLSKYDVCGWYVLGNSPSRGVNCNDENIPTSLYLDKNSLVGSIPKENGMLTTLEALVMEDNDIMGNIPSELCQLTGLNQLALDFNDLTGAIPECGDRWSNMEYLYLHFNFLEGKFDNLCSLESLKNLYLGFNTITGNIPSCLKDMSSLVELFVGNNLLSGTFPEDTSSLSNLEVLVMDDNMIEGDVNSFNSQSKLELLYGEKNLLSGNLATFGAGLEHLQQLDFANNSITCEDGFPSHLLSLPELQVLDVSRNHLSGTLPLEISTESKLVLLSLHHNMFTGQIPSSLPNLQRLVQLDLSNAQFSGSIPDAFASMVDLHYLYLANNPNLEAGPIPDSFSTLTKLQELSLKNTNRNGTIPEFLGQIEKIYMLDLDNNNLSGSVPGSLGELEQLRYLLLSRNNLLNDTLPESFNNLNELVNLFVDGTSISGSLQELCQLPYISGDEDVEGEPAIIADCKNGNPVTCSCCYCCDNSIDDGCSLPEVTNLDLEWEKAYARTWDSFDFGIDFNSLQKSM